MGVQRRDQEEVLESEEWMDEEVTEEEEREIIWKTDGELRFKERDSGNRRQDLCL